jgi:cyclophilin family peptidyl-prolyl cis-trans isomerase
VPEEIVKTMRRLPLEVDGQDSGKGLHKRWALTMSRNQAEDSAVSAFSIMLKDAPHLNHEYTVFGTLVPDNTTIATMDKIARIWSVAPSYITSAKEISHIKYSVIEKDGSRQERICTALYCGIKPPEKVATTPQYEQYPAFKEKSDGPLLSQPKNLEIKTSSGNIHIVLEPSLAPINATQMYRLFHSGVFDGTLLSRYEPHFVLQTGLADTKAGMQTLTITRKAMLRNLPLEVACQAKGQGLHKKFALSMAHGDDPNSASSSFSILLGSAPHLDHKYTVFGHAGDDAETVKTLAKIEDDWAKTKPHIISVSEVSGNTIATVSH